MTKRQYRTPKVVVGTVKKSMAAIASRWLLKNVSQRCQPAPAHLWPVRHSLKPSRCCRLRNVETELLQFAVDTVLPRSDFQPRCGRSRPEFPCSPPLCFQSFAS